jgi:pimeloyl-ACP methyl ester carboxylesterase
MPSLHVHDLGTGPPVVLLHPGPGLDGSVFLPGAEMLAGAGYRVVAVDLPGNGRSPRGDPAEWTLAGFARAVEGLVRELALEHWTLLGHSFGGYVAMQHLVDFPGSAARLIASCTDADADAPPGMPDPYAELPAGVEAAFEREATVATPEECREVWLGQMPFFAVDVEAAARMLDDVVFVPEMHHERDWGDLHALPALAATDTPVLAIAGEHDRPTPPPLAERIAATAPHGELLVIDGVGHFPFAEAPERYWPAISAWLERTEPPGTRMPGR